MACAITMSCARMHLGLHAPRPHLAIVTAVRGDLLPSRFLPPCASISISSRVLAGLYAPLLSLPGARLARARRLAMPSAPDDVHSPRARSFERGRPGERFLKPALRRTGVASLPAAIVQVAAARPRWR